MSGITTHILDISHGTPAGGVVVTLEIKDLKIKDLEIKKPGGWRRLGEGRTDEDGRVGDFGLDEAIIPATYRLTFATGDYFAERETDTFYPRAVIEFEVQDPSQHYHVPLLLSPFGYSTYRGS